MTFFVVEIVEGDRLMLDQHRSFLIEKPFESLNGINQGIENDFCSGVELCGKLGDGVKKAA